MRGDEIAALRGLAYAGPGYWLAMTAADMGERRSLVDRGLVECELRSVGHPNAAIDAWFWRITPAGVAWWHRPSLPGAGP